MSSPEVVDRILRGGKTLQERMRKGPRIIVPENRVKFDEVKQHPNLNENDHRIRFNPFTGELFISAYRHRANDLDNTQEDKNPPRKIVQRWNRYSDIESAIRSSEHVLKSYDKKNGKMVQNTLGAISVIKDLLKKFEIGEISEVNIDNIGEETFNNLQKYGFEKAQKPVRQKLTEQVIFASGRDSLQRFNPLISRTRLASAWIKTIKELLVAKSIREKYSEVFTILSVERDVERMYIQSASELMVEVLGSVDMLQLREKVEMLRDYFRNFLTPDKIRVAPYRKDVLLSGYSLFGPRNEWDKKLIQRMGENGKKIAETPPEPIDNLLRKPEILQMEVMERVFGVLTSFNSVLSEGDKNLKKE